jgi:hypothetical protein
MHVGSLFALFHRSSVAAQGGWLVYAYILQTGSVQSLYHSLEAHVNCRVSLADGCRFELGFKQCSLNHMHLTLTVIR